MGNASKSPKTRNKLSEVRIQRLKKFENWGGELKINFDDVVDKKLLAEHMQNLNNMYKEMERCQTLAAQIRTEIETNLRSHLR